MITKVKNKIQEYLRSIKTIENKTELNYSFIEDHIAYSQLLKMFDNNTFLPLTKWSISPKEVVHICNDLVINKRKSIIEFGSGFSTVCIAQLLKINNIKATFFSVENDIEWAVELNNILHHLKLNEYVEIILAPIKDVPIQLAKDTQKKWYDTDILNMELREVTNFDLVIVDGPFGGITPFARYSAIPFLEKKIALSYSIFLDDTHRVDEKQIGEDWKILLEGQLNNFKIYSRLSNNSGFEVSPFGVKY
jgi:hypothetical protein